MKILYISIITLLLISCTPIPCPSGYEDIGIGQCVKKEDNKNDNKT
jgi:hypothetical protein